MRQIHEGAVREPPSWISSILLLFVYSLCVVLAAVTLVITAIASSPG
jgi:hypothetical protein